MSTELESIVRSLVPEGEALLWIGESDRRALQRRNWIGLGSLLASVPLALIVAAGLISVAIYLQGFLPSNNFGRIAGSMIKFGLLIAIIFPIVLALIVPIRLGLGIGFGERAVVTGITERRIIAATGPGTMHQRICVSGTFQQMVIRPAKDDAASFTLLHSSKEVPPLHIRYVRPAQKIAQLLQAQLAALPNPTLKTITEGTSP